MWQDWANAVLGLVLVGMAFFGAVDTTYAWAFGILGALIAVVGFWGAAGLPEGTMRHA